MTDEPRPGDPEQQHPAPDASVTQGIPERAEATVPLPTAPTSSSDGRQPAEAPAEDAWFEVFGGEHPADGPVVPGRADASWGSDRAEALRSASERDAAASYWSGAGAPPAAGAAAADAARAVPGGSGPDSAWPPPAPVSARPRGRRGLLVAGVVGLCLLSGVVGGVVGQVAEDRVALAGSTLPDPGPGVTARPSGSVASVAARAVTSVVTIKVDAGGEGSATGSGFVIDRKGHVLTNNHVVQSAKGQVDVILSNGDTEKATVVGKDATYDLAVLRIGRTDLTPLVLGPSDKVVVGDQVIAVGAPLGLDQTVTTGIVSALNRPVQPGEPGESTYINAVQTDAAINPGNSGGPLLDMAGQVIGVNSAIARVPGTGGTTGGSIGLGFAIPSDQARRTADQLIATGKATHPVIGVRLDPTFAGEGAQVKDEAGAVTKGGPAAKAGVQPGDVVVGFEGRRIRTPDQLIVAIRARAVGDTVTLTVRRGGAEVDLKMTLEADPDN